MGLIAPRAEFDWPDILPPISMIALWSRCVSQNLAESVFSVSGRSSSWLGNACGRNPRQPRNGPSVQRSSTNLGREDRSARRRPFYTFVPVPTCDTRFRESAGNRCRRPLVIPGLAFGSGWRGFRATRSRTRLAGTRSGPVSSGSGPGSSPRAMNLHEMPRKIGDDGI